MLDSNDRSPDTAGRKKQIRDHQLDPLHPRSDFGLLVVMYKGLVQHEDTMLH